AARCRLHRAQRKAAARYRRDARENVRRTLAARPGRRVDDRPGGDLAVPLAAAGRVLQGAWRAGCGAARFDLLAPGAAGAMVVLPRQFDMAWPVAVLRRIS